jgi:ADP-heptose:LPS heptosyltransferase
METGIKKIAVLKGPGIGDVITSTPLLRNLRKNFPSAEITVFNEISYGHGNEILKNCPYVNRTTEINQKSVFSLLKIIRKTRKEKFDMIIDSFPSTWKTALFCRLSGTKYRLGYKNNKLSGFYNIKVKYEGKNKVDLEAELLEKLGIKIDSDERDLEIFFDLEKNSQKINELLKEHQIKSTDTIIGIHAGRTEDKVRTWVDEKWAGLCDKIADEYGAKIVLIGGNDDSERAKNIISLTKSKPADLTGQLNLEETATLISNMDLFLCINGGPMHIAAALKIPLIALCGDTKLGWDPYGKNCFVIRKNTEIFRDTNYKKGDNYYMRLIEIGDVSAMIEKIID